MNVLIFGATGMIGQGILRECLLDPQVHLVQTIGRTSTGQQNPKLRELTHPDLWNYAPIEKNSPASTPALQSRRCLVWHV